MKLFRKSEPSEILAQLEPVLKENEFMWQDILGAFQAPLRKRGIEIYVEPNDAKDPYASGDWTRICITDEPCKEKPSKFKKS